MQKHLLACLLKLGAVVLTVGCCGTAEDALNGPCCVWVTVSWLCVDLLLPYSEPSRWFASTSQRAHVSAPRPQSDDRPVNSDHERDNLICCSTTQYRFLNVYTPYPPSQPFLARLGIDVEAMHPSIPSSRTAGCANGMVRNKVRGDF